MQKLLKFRLAPGCGSLSEYRSMIACGLLERAGYRNVVNVGGGFDARHAAKLPEVAEQLAKA